jgi:Cdc6-like AAA superfamily ATPase
MTNVIKNGFFAYPSQPPHCGEFIEEAIKKIHKSGHLVFIKSWKSMEVGGKLIISQILNQIDSSDFVCADVTGLNENVLFELGFAIGKGKSVWILQDVSITESYNRFKELNFLTTVGYINYTNSDDIANAFIREKPFNHTNLLLNSYLNSTEETTNKNSLLYLKSQFDTDYNKYILNTIDSYKLPTIVDDAVEVKIQPLSWYIGHILSVPAVLVEFSSTFRTGMQLHNAKCAFVGGLSLGLGLKVQMVAEKPFPTALDYQEYLKKFTNLELCRAAIIPFLNNLKTEIAQLIGQKKEVFKTHKRRESKLQKLKFGEYIAEHESADLYDYYVNTAHDENLLKSEYNIVVGRKGSGKTATLYYLTKSLGNDIRNEVIPIKPVNFEIDGLVQVVKKLRHDFEKGFIIQSIWKFLIYTEVAKEVYLKIKEKPLYALNTLDATIVEFVEENKSIILSDFSSRLEQELLNLEILKDVEEQSVFRERVSEILHDRIIGHLKELIIQYMNNRKKMVVLIDNLDKNWRKGQDFETISKFILGLLGVIGRIAKELKGSPKKPNEFGLHLIVFLRSDIFNHVLEFAREPDKIEYYRLKWSDPEVLFRLLDKRLEYLSENGIKGTDNFWRDFVTESIDGIDTKEFIHSCIIPRPRDLIYFLNSAKSIAVSRGRDAIDENDIKSAYEDYSNWVFKSILVESVVSAEQMQIFLYTVMSEHSILTKEKISDLMCKSGIPINDETVEQFINHLCSMTFIGREIRQSTFEYEYDFENDEKIIALAKKYNSNRFKIHNAFIPYLECSDYIK